LITFSKTRLEKYAPFDVVTIYNNSNVQVTAVINQNSDLMYPVAAKSEREIDKIWCHSLLLRNDSTSTAVDAGEIIVFFERKGVTADEAAKQQAKRWLW